MAGRIPTPELNRFLAEAVQARQPPVGTRRGSSQHRLKLIYMAQIGERPPRFAIQVNSRARVTRDYAYFLENRLRARYGMDGVPLIIDFVERGQRGRARGRVDFCDFRQPRRLPPRRDRRRARHLEPSHPCHEPAFRQRVPVHLRVGHGGPPRQDRRPDLRRRARRRARATTPTAAWPARRSSTPA